MLMMLKSILVGAACAYAANLLYTLVILISAHRKNMAIGTGAWQAFTLHSSLFWVVICAAFWCGTFFTMRHLFPPLYR
jgi:hypothetical protein